ncbi:hypothetical protein X798_04693 [Onchocerca flexuosa]|uniref:Uncharacterized protein n=1 Tax=Onchocerca flexuosa TaxID=387005 RepID=A0A238BUH7_9BILA|nr:hypothetical protein X798_04693 [Onchocerca flexuosa]
MLDSRHLDLDLFQIDRTFAESFWSIPIIFHLFGTALVLLHPETRILAWIFFRETFVFLLATIILIEQLANNVMVEAVKRSMTSKSSTTTANISDIRSHSVTILDVGEPLQWDEILIAILLSAIALTLFITGMYMVDRIQHGKDRLFRKYIDQQKRFRKSTIIDKIMLYFIEQKCQLL